MNPAIPSEAREEALCKVLRLGTSSLTQTNRAFHRLWRDSVPVEYPRADGSIAGDSVWLLDFGKVVANDWLAVNQFTVIEGQYNRRPDIVVFLNGPPLGLIELKNALELEVLVRDRQHLRDLLQHFMFFEQDPDSGALHRIIASYHQFHAVNAAAEETVRASGMTNNGKSREDTGTYWASRMHGGKPGGRRAGVVWHTQGSGKSFIMLFFAARIIREPVMQNPTLVLLTDRNDFDDQLFGQFQRCANILGQIPVQTDSREELRELLAAASGKVYPKTGERTYDFASNIRAAVPNASFISFTGTPIEKTDANTRARCSAITSASMTSSAQSPTKPRCRSTTRAARKSSSPSGPHWKRWSTTPSASNSSPPIW